MILDALLQFDPPNTTINIAPGTQISTNIIDLHGAGLIPVLANNQGARDIGVGDDPAMKIVVQAGVTFVGGGTIQVAVQGAPDNGSGAPSGTWTTYATGPVSAVNPVAGTRLCQIDMPRPRDGLLPRFLRLQYTIATGTLTTSGIQAYLVLDRDDAPNIQPGVFGGYPPGVAIAN